MDIHEAARRAEVGGHHLFAPSYSPTWKACPGSLLASVGAPDTAGADAAWGTVFHSTVEQWLRTGKKPAAGVTQAVRAGGVTHQIEITEEMLTAASDCMALVEGVPGKRYIETKVDFSDLTPVPNQKGTVDVFFLQDDGTAVLWDWKGGKGVRVYCDTPQIWLYAYGVFREWDWLYNFQRIQIGIAQPRLDHYDSKVITRAELLAFAEEVRVAAHLAASPDAPRIPGEKQCRFCKVRTTCPALAVALDDLVVGAFDDVVRPVSSVVVSAMNEGISNRRTLIREPTPPATLTTASLARALAYRKMMESWFGAVADELLARSQAGETVPGWRLVQGREGNRRWVNSTEAAAAIGEATKVQVSELYHSILMSPAEAATLLRSRGIKGKQADVFLEPLVDRAPGKPTLVPDTDGRSSLPDPADAFENV